MCKFGNKTVGILALQGDYERHLQHLELLGAKGQLVRLPADLVGIDCLILPGGESTTMDILLDRFDLREPLRQFCLSHPVFGTCAGMVMLSQKIDNNSSGVKPLALMDIDVLRNGYGRQIHSFEETLEAELGNGTRRLVATFIRAPKVLRTGSGVTVLSYYRDVPVLVRQKNLLASCFHPELGEDTALLEYFLSEC